MAGPGVGCAGLRLRRALTELGVDWAGCRLGRAPAEPGVGR
ncbi:hypothetical protein ABT300_27565 [Streptomyces sp. NPDC001027]